MENSSGNDIAKRFTDNVYATKNEVRKGLNTSLVDPFWNVILSYRSIYTKTINVKTIGNLSYSICFTETIKNKLNAICEKLNRSVSMFLNLKDELKESVKTISMSESLSLVGKYYNESLSNDFIKSVINDGASNFQGISEPKKRVIEYFDAYKLLELDPKKIDADFLVKLYLAVSKKENITTIYRSFNFTSNAANVINQEFNGAPFNMIEKMMNGLYAFLEDQKYSSIVKAGVAYFYLNHIKPFESHNKEIAMLLFKAIINKDQTDSVNYLIPFEEFLLHDEEFEKDFKEVTRGNDITYVLIRVVNLSDSIIEKFLDNCTKAKTDDLKLEHTPTLDENTPEAVQSLETSKINENSENTVIEKPKQIAIPSIQSGLEEKDAHKFEKYLLERNPRLKKTQAHYYARHCTIGSYYTIQDFKKFEKVVYETARTSMESLVEFGYYRKEQIKNKFVYTPIKIEGK